MERNLEWTSSGWNDYLEWQNENIKIIRKINDLIKDAKRNPFSGLGKPEALKGNLKGYWSRRITDEHRLVYLVEKEKIIISSCKGHYE